MIIDCPYCHNPLEIAINKEISAKQSKSLVNQALGPAKEFLTWPKREYNTTIRKTTIYGPEMRNK